MRYKFPPAISSIKSAGGTKNSTISIRASRSTYMLKLTFLKKYTIPLSVPLARAFPDRE